MWSSLTLPQLPFKRRPLLLSRAPQAFMCNCSRFVSRDRLLWTRQRSASNWRITVSCCICIVQEYKERRDFVCNMLIQAGFSNFLKPQGSFFVFAQLPDKCPLNDVSKHSDPSILESVSWRAAVSPKMWILRIWGWRAAVLWVHSFSKCFLQKFHYSLMGFWAPIKQHRTGETTTEMVPRFGHQSLLWVC